MNVTWHRGRQLWTDFRHTVTGWTELQNISNRTGGWQAVIWTRELPNTNQKFWRSAVSFQRFGEVTFFLFCKESGPHYFLLRFKGLTSMTAQIHYRSLKALKTHVTARSYLSVMRHLFLRNLPLISSCSNTRAPTYAILRLRYVQWVIAGSRELQHDTSTFISQFIISFVTFFSLPLSSNTYNHPAYPRTVNGQRLSWLGYLEIMEEDRMPKKIFTVDLEGTRRRGRPTKRWKEEVERVLQVLGVRGWRELVADRKEWRTVFDRPKPTVGWSANGSRSSS